MNAIIESLCNRRSVRVFEDKPIPQEIKDELLRCAAQAPTAGNQQFYTIIDVTDQALKDQLAVTCDNQPFLATAPLVLVFLADGRRWYDCYRLAGANPRDPGPGDLLLACADACIAAQNLVVAAESLGLGSCYIGDILENKEQQQELLGLPKYCVPACMLVVGYPVADRVSKVKAPRFEPEYIVHENRYREFTDSELREMYQKRADKGAGTVTRSFDEYMQRFCARKYNADFSKEMNRSAYEFLRDFLETD